jgi:hypothetical protein
MPYDPLLRLPTRGSRSSGGGSPTGPAGGDLSGTYPNPTVSKINGTTLGTTTATSGHLLVADGAAWQSVAMSGDATIVSGGALTLNTVTVPKGGTGDTTLTAHGVLVGEGTSAVAVTAAGTAGQLLIGQGATSDPVFTSMSADATIAATGALTLATVNANVGTFGDGTHVAQVTVNAKGLTTAVSNVLITGAAPSGAAGGDLAGTYPNPTVAKINTVALGTTTATSTNLLIADGSQWVSRTMTGDATISNTGVITLAPQLQVDNSQRVGFAFYQTPGSTIITQTRLAGTKTTTGTLTESFDTDRFYVNYATSTALNNTANVDISAVGPDARVQHLPDAWFYFKTGAAATDIANVRIFVLLVSASLGSAPGDTLAAGESAMGFRFSTSVSDAPNWQTFTREGAGNTSTVKSSGVAIAADTPYVFRIKVKSTTAIDFYINNVLVQSYTSGGGDVIPPAATNLGWVINITNLSAGTARNMKFHKYWQFMY